jgi:hypothetical protein
MNSSFSLLYTFKRQCQRTGTLKRWRCGAVAETRWRNNTHFAFVSYSSESMFKLHSWKSRFTPWNSSDNCARTYTERKREREREHEDTGPGLRRD